MGLRGRFPLALVDDFSDTGHFPGHSRREEADLMGGVGAEHCGNGTQLGGKIRMNEQDAHGVKNKV
jgi:hypothetical protein